MNERSTLPHAKDILSNDNWTAVELKKTQEELRKLTKKLLLATQSVGIGIWEYVLAENKVYLDDNILDIYGIADDYDGNLETLQQYVHPDDYERVSSGLSKAITSDLGFNAEFRIERPDGHICYIKLTGVIEKDANGKTMRVIGTNQDITQQKEFELKLQEREKSFNEAQRLALIGSWNLDLRNKEMQWSEETYRIFGVEPDLYQVSYTSFLEFIHPEDITSVNGFYTSSVKEKTCFNITHRIVTKDGVTKYVNSRCETFYNHELGIRSVGTLQDITANILAERKIVQSENNLKTIFENTSEGFILTDKDLFVKDFNTKAIEYALFNGGKKIAKGLNLMDFLPDSKHDFYKSVTAQALAGKIIKFDRAFPAANGSNTWLSLTFTPVRDGNNITGVCITGLDITERKEAEEALARSEKQYRQIVETAQEGIWTIDENNITTFVNKKMCEILEYTYEEVMGRPNHLFRNGGEKKNLQEQIERRKKGISEHHEARYLTKTGKHVIANISTNPIFDEEGNYKGALAMVTDITTRKNAEDKLEAANNELKILFNTIDEVFFSIDLVSSRLIHISPGCEKLYGYKQEDFLKDVSFFWGKLVHPDDVHILANGRQKLLAGHQTLDRYRIIHKDGSIRWVESKLIPTLDKTGKAIRLDGITRDVSLQKQSEAELKSSNERYETVSKATNDAVWDWNLTTNDIWWNDNFFARYGYGKNIDTGINLWYAGIHPDDKDRILEDLNNALATKSHSWQGEYRFKKADGEYLHVFDRGYILYNEADKPYRMIGSMADITARKKAQDDLKKSEDGYRQIVETAQEGIWMIDDQNLTTFVNKKMCEILGYSETEMIGKSHIHFRNEKGKKDFVDQIERRRQGISEQHEGIYINKEGKEVIVNISTNPIFNDDGSYRGALAMITDISKRKEQELLLKKNTEERELLISELIKSNYDLQQFSYITSHNFRAPLSNLISLLNLIETDSLNDNNKLIIEMFRSSTDQLNKTINDLIEILIIKNSKNLEMVENDMKQVYHEVYASIANQIQDTRSIITYNFEAKEVFFHTTYLKSVLMNLLTNAIKYRSPERQLVISISTKHTANGDTLLTVTDNGLGIDLKRHSDSMFGLYQKFHDNPESVGLGLFIVKSQVMALGGNIDVQSEVDKGTSFLVTFKQKKNELAE